MATAGSGPGTQQPWGFRLEMVGTHRNGGQRGVGLAQMVGPEGTEDVSGECRVTSWPWAGERGQPGRISLEGGIWDKVMHLFS